MFRFRKDAGKKIESCPAHRVCRTRYGGGTRKLVANRCGTTLSALYALAVRSLNARRRLCSMAFPQIELPCRVTQRLQAFPHLANKSAVIQVFGKSQCV